MRFVNREKELKILEKWWSEKHKSHLIILYGRRRVGKTKLCLEFIKNKPSIYFLAEQLPIDHQLKNLSQKVGNYFDDEILTSRGAQDWEQFFKYLADKREHLILVIDEFPYLVEAEKGISSLFQKGWDLYLKNSPVFLVLSGSSVSMMMEHTLTYKAPLYGRRSGQIELKPFDFTVLDQIFTNRSFKEKIEIFSVAGGIPAYLEVFADTDEEIENLLAETVFRQEHFLGREVEFLLRQELREPRNYLAILTAIANKCTRLSEIMNQTGFDRPTLSRYLSILQDLGFVAREVPVTAKYPSRSKQGSYQIADAFFNFWFQLVFPNRDKIERGDSKFLIKNYRKKKGQVCSSTYEHAAQDILREQYNFERLGRWWDKNDEIDVVGLSREENKILFGEVKWSNRQVGINVYRSLLEKSHKVVWGDKDTQKQFVLFSKSGFTEAMKKRARKENVLLFNEDRPFRV